MPTAGLIEMPPEFEDDALADEGEGLFVAAAAPRHHDDLGRAFGPLPHGQKRPHPELLEICLLQHLDLHAELRQALQPLGEFCGGQDVRGFVDEIPCEIDAFGQRGLSARAVLCSLGSAHDRQSSARVGLLRQVGVEGVAPQKRREDDVVQTTQPAAEDERALGTESRANGGACLPRGLALCLAVEPDHLHRLGGEPRWPRHEMRAAVLHLAESLAFGEALQRAARQLVDPPSVLVERPVLGDEDDDAPFSNCNPVEVGVGEVELRQVGHGILGLGWSLIARRPFPG